jgi:(S)-ureidoglycine-glyoxylate aminotransferase
MGHLARCPSPQRPGIAEDLYMLLMIPGPIEVEPRVIAAMNRPAVNPHGRDFMAVLDKLFQVLQEVFQTESWVTAIAGTGRTGLEAAIASAVEPDQATVHIVNGSFGELMVEIASRVGTRIHTVGGRWGGPVDLDAVENTVRQVRPKVVTMVHCETSTGTAYHELQAVSRICSQYGALFMVDAVSAIGTMPFYMDEAGVDLAVAASNKGLGALHGLTMIGVSDRAKEVMAKRSAPCQSYSMDLHRWDELYFHSASDRRRSAYPPPTHLVYALLEACRLLMEEGLSARWRRCQRFAEATRQALAAANLEIFPDPSLASASVTAIVIPAGIDGAAVLKDMEAHGVQIAGTVGRISPITGRIWRISHQGIQASEVMLIPTLAVFEASLRRAGYPVAPGTMVSTFQEAIEVESFEKPPAS